MQPNTPVQSALHASRPENFEGIWRTDLLARELYSEGAGIARTRPAAVAVPRDANDVAALVRWARRDGHFLMARGSGSGMAAGAIGPGVTVDLSQLKTIEPVDSARRRMRMGPGAVRNDIDRLARSTGLRFPVDPSSGAFCTIGGMVGANASGARSLKYGPTREWVTGIECVFDDGSVAWIRRDEALPLHIPAVARLSKLRDLLGRTAANSKLSHPEVLKESSGYALRKWLSPNGHLVDLLVGSEGTLAAFTAVELGLTSATGATASLLAKFGSLEAATECALRARAAGASACELLDKTFLDVAASQGAAGVPTGAEAVLLAEVEGVDSDDAANAANRLAAEFRAQGAINVVVAADAGAEHELWELRHATSPILSRLAPRLRSLQFIEDGCVPPQNLPEYVRGVRAALKAADFPGVIFGHAGDAHIHVNPLVDVRSGGWRDRVHGALMDVCELTARLGGTLAGEHGDGRLRAPLLQHVWAPEARAAFANVKDTADPAGVFNVGCKIAPASDDFASDLRHDPAAAPLSDQARAILDRIEQGRDWNRFRLAEIA